MNKKLPRVYVNGQSEKIENNKEMFYSKNTCTPLSNNDTSKDMLNALAVKKKINDIFSSNSFVYKTEVKIKIEDKEIIETIIAKTNNSLLTMQNKIIPICIIKDINIV